jgi:hypothetical protein
MKLDQVKGVCTRNRVRWISDQLKMVGVLPEAAVQVAFDIDVKYTEEDYKAYGQ